MRELLILSPLNFLVAEGCLLFLEIDVLGLTPPRMSILPEVIEVFMEPLIHIVAIIIIILSTVMAELLRNVNLVLQTRSDLSDVQLDEM